MAMDTPEGALEMFGLGHVQLDRPTRARPIVHRALIISPGGRVQIMFAVRPGTVVEVGATLSDRSVRYHLTEVTEIEPNSRHPGMICYQATAVLSVRSGTRLVIEPYRA